MKLLIYVFFCSVVLNLHAQEKANCALNIAIANDLDIPELAILELSYFDSNSYIVNPLTITGRTISFKKKINEPVLADLVLKWKDRRSVSYRFLLPIDTGTILIKPNNKVTIKFNNQNELFEGYDLMSQQILSIKQLSANKTKAINFENRQMKEVQKEIDSISSYYENLLDNEVYKKTIDLHKDNFLGVIALIDYAERPFSHQRRKFQTDSLLGIFNSFSAKMKVLSSMKTLYNLLLSEKAINQGMLFPSFKLMNTVNQVQNLNKYYGKYTLIDFWANWCTPCRAEHPNLISQYKKYRKKGLVILSVSIDKITDKNLWREAITKDGIALWSHFIDFEQAAKKQLNIRFIPSNFLLNGKGVIIAKDLSGNELNAKLEKIFEN